MFSKWNYSVQNVAGNTDTLEIHLDSVILDADTEAMYKEFFPNDPSVSFKSFRDQILASGAKNLDVYINSNGGYVFDAMAMHDFLKMWNRGWVRTEVRGIAASAATYPAMAVENSNIAENAFLFIHEVQGGVYGSVSQVENYAQQLRVINDAIAQFYSEKSGIGFQTIRNMMCVETMIPAKEAVTKGFIKNLVSAAPAQPIPASNWTYKNKAALNQYNAAAGKLHKQDEAPEAKFAFNKSTIMNLAERIAAGVTNALKELGIEIKPDGTGEVKNTLKVDELVTNVTKGINTDLQKKIDEQALEVTNLKADLETAKEANNKAIQVQNELKVKNQTLTADLQKALGKEALPNGGDTKPDDVPGKESAIENFGKTLKGVLGI